MTGSVLLTGIGELFSGDPVQPLLADAAIVVEGGQVAWVGPRAAAP